MRCPTVKRVCSFAAVAAVPLFLVGCETEAPLGSDPMSAPRPPGPSFQETATVPSTELLASDGTAHDAFGRSVSISGDLLIIGASQDDDPVGGAGSAYVLRRAGTGWDEEQKLQASDLASGDFFGEAVFVDGELAIVGAPADDLFGLNSGSAYIFRRAGTAWTQEEKLIPSDGAASDAFGFRVSVDSETEVAVVTAINHSDGAVGFRTSAAYVFRNGPSGWQEEKKLLPGDPAPGDNFGYGVSIRDNVILVGDPDIGSGLPGAAYVFRKAGTDWVQEQKLVPGDVAPLDNFGWAVFVSGNLAIVGSVGDDDAGNRSGSAYIFRSNAASWIEEAKLTAADGAPEDRFGFSVSISGEEEVAVVGAWLHDGAGTDAGAAYLFRLGGAGWFQEAELTASDPADFDRFGDRVAVGAETAIVTSWHHAHLGVDSGAAWVFSLSLSGRIDFLKASVDDLVASGALNEVQGEFWLKAKLNLAQQFIEQGYTVAAIQVLGVFILQVEGLINEGTLTPDEGLPLIEGAQAIIDDLGG
jgi:hypothetical protein